MPDSAAPAIPLNVRRLAEDFCLEVGLPCTNEGFEMAVLSISLAYQTPKLTEKMDKDLYPAVAQVLGRPIVPKNLRRRIDFAICEAFAHDRGGNPYKYFRHIIRTDKGKPTVGEFIYTGTRYIRDHLHP